jgi:hypothetical protein
VIAVVVAIACIACALTSPLSDVEVSPQEALYAKEVELFEELLQEPAKDTAPHKDSVLVATKDAGNGILGPAAELKDEKAHPDPSPMAEGGGGYDPDPLSYDSRDASVGPDGSYHLGKARRRVGAGFNPGKYDWDEPPVKGWKEYKGHHIFDGEKIKPIRDEKLSHQTKVGSILAHPKKLKAMNAADKTISTPETTQGAMDSIYENEHLEEEAIRHNETKGRGYQLAQGPEVEEIEWHFPDNKVPEDEIYKTIDDKITKAILGARAEEAKEEA